MGGECGTYGTVQKKCMPAWLSKTQKSENLKTQAWFGV